ncbi:MAG: histone deacetylase family protein [Alphaproteobacteria bacterium]
MLVVRDDAHLAHQPAEIISRGRAAPHPEVARRAAELEAAAKAGGHELVKPRAHGMAPVAAVHDEGYLAFLESAWTRWQALPNPTPYVHPYAQPNRRMTGLPTGVLGQAGYYMATNSAPIAEGTWGAALASADIALTAADAVTGGDDAAYALCRPPGHHAFTDLAGGFCYLNNVAIAAQHMTTRWPKLAILDIDVHHGNGTQGIFYERDDVLFVSLHGDPSDYFPFFAGYAGETGAGAGAGKNLNLPLPQGSGDKAFLEALEQGFRAIRAHGPGALLVSLGFDAFENDPIGCLKITTPGFGEVARRIGALGLPTLLVQEGGYDCDGLGPNLTSFLGGFAAGRAG